MKTKYWFLFLVLVFFATCKTTKEVYVDKKPTEKNRLLKKINNKQDAIDSLIYFGHELLKYDINGKVIRPNSISKSGNPLYFKEQHGESLRETVKADVLHPLGSTGFNLEGQGVEVGVWDSNAIFKDHSEFSYFNGTNSVIITSNAESQTISSSHPTSVSSVIISQGLFHDERYDVTGIAPKISKLFYRNWDLVESEIINLVSDNPKILVSNHSYGYPIYDEDQEDFVFTNEEIGQYTDDDSTLDEIANTFPYHMYVTSAGNDGSVLYPGQEHEGYDMLLTGQLGKNILTVAAVSENNFGLVQPTAFSQAGPTNDGRIKPEIAAPGSSVIVATWDDEDPSSDDVYSLASGTSFSSPAVAGGVALLQQHYHNLNNQYMLSSTVKGLLCHSADDIPSWNSFNDVIGPDPKTGFGLMNLEKAAQVISTNATDPLSIVEFDLENGETYTLNFTSIDSEQKLEATISWNDPVSTALFREKELVNDIDIRINDENNTFFPWKLDPTDITNPAVRGDNLVDNIEKIEVENPNGDYEITVSHKGTLESPQKVSLIVSGNGNLTLSRNNYELGDKKLLIYPIPATDLLYIRSIIEDAGIISVKLMDLNSRVVYRLNQVDETLIQIPTYNLEKGVYFVSVEFQDYTLSKKITLQ
jgi:hypothetical protein